MGRHVGVTVLVAVVTVLFLADATAAANGWFSSLFATRSVTTPPDCPLCVQSQGYVKTHGPQGPSSYDPAWDNFGLWKLCGSYDSMTILSNCKSITTNTHWCNVARHFVTLQFNLMSGTCHPSDALAFNSTLLALYNNISGLCFVTPGTYVAGAGV